VGRDGRVIDLHLLTGRARAGGVDRRGRERCWWGGTARARTVPARPEPSNANPTPA